MASGDKKDPKKPALVRSWNLALLWSWFLDLPWFLLGAWIFISHLVLGEILENK